MAFLVFNIVLFIASLLLVYSGFANFALFLDLPIGMEILIVIGFITPVMNLYDTIKNFNEIILANNPPTQEEEDED